MAKDNKSLRKPSSNQEIGAFLNQVKALAPRNPAGSGRLLFAMDATASRQGVWDRAMQVQGEMFLQAARVGSLQIKLAYYRGFMECYALPWSSSGVDLLKKMSEISCAAGTTQIARILKLAITEHEQRKINAVVFVGDSMEEDCDKLAHLAGRLGILGAPVFVFQDGHDVVAEKTFREIARLSKGVWCRFDANSANQLRDLLCGVAVYASGGSKALKTFSRNKSDALKLLSQHIK
jgi:hypothetical protein